MWDSIFGTNEPDEPTQEDNKENSPRQSEQSNVSLASGAGARKAATDWNVVLGGKERSNYGPWAKGSLREKMYRKYVLGEEVEEPKPELEGMPKTKGPATAKETRKSKPHEGGKKPKKRRVKKDEAPAEGAAAEGEEKETPKTKYERCLQEGMDHIDRVKRLYEDIKLLETKPCKFLRMRASQMWQDLDDILEDYHNTIAQHQQLIDIFEHIGEACDNVELELQRKEILPWFAGDQLNLDEDLVKEEEAVKAKEDPDEEYPDWAQQQDWEWLGMDRFGTPAPEGVFKGPPVMKEQKKGGKPKKKEPTPPSSDDESARPFRHQFC